MSTEKTLVGRPVLKKLAKVMAAVMPVAKAGENKFQHYKYATEADVVMAIRGELIKQGLVILPSASMIEIKDAAPTSSGTAQYLTIVDMHYTIFDSESGDCLQCQFIGQGMDTGDKGIYKAMTGANKYFLLKTFQIPTTDDPEADEKTDKNNPAPEPEINWFPRKAGAGQWMCSACGKRHMEAGDMVGRIGDKKWAAKACYEHTKKVDGATTPEEEDADTKFRATLEQMDIEQLREQGYMIADEKHMRVDFRDNSKEAVIEFIMENRTK